MKKYAQKAWCGARTLVRQPIHVRIKQMAAALRRRIICRNYYIRRAHSAIDAGLPERATEYAEKALAMDNTHKPAHMILVKMLMPGPHYQLVLADIHKWLTPGTYMEIGVSAGQSMSLASAKTKAIGIDPYPKISHNIDAQAKLFPVTSDTFFRNWNLKEQLNGCELDLVFIDGLHTFEQTLRDFINVEKYCEKKTIIVFHDCLPVTKVVAEIERTTRFWCGDVWKIARCLKRYRPDLYMAMVPTAPSGLLFVSNLDNTSQILDADFERIVEELHGEELGYECLTKSSLASMADIIPNDPVAIKNKLESWRGDRKAVR